MGGGHVGDGTGEHSLRPRPRNPLPPGPPQSRGGAAPRRPAGETLHSRPRTWGLAHRGRDETYQEKVV